LRNSILRCATESTRSILFVSSDATPSDQQGKRFLDRSKFTASCKKETIGCLALLLLHLFFAAAGKQQFPAIESSSGSPGRPRQQRQPNL